VVITWVSYMLINMYAPPFDRTMERFPSTRRSSVGGSMCASLPSAREVEQILEPTAWKLVRQTVAENVAVPV
jgi:hypothetical protein